MAIASCFNLENVGRNRKLTLAAAALILLSATALSPAHAGDNCCVEQDEATLTKRLESAERLIADGTRLDETNRALIHNLKVAAGGVTENVYQSYEGLFKQYYDALAAYQQHRRDYLDHVQSYHTQNQQPEMISPSQSYGSNQQPVRGGLQPLKYKTQDKCDQMQQLESTIIANEQQLTTMVSNLMIAQQKESAAMFANEWSAANQLAIQNSRFASQFNDLGILKTAQVSRSVHNLIMEANRDGAYNAHMEAYQNLSTSNGMEQLINKRSNMHASYAMQTMTQLAAMRPAGMPMNGPAAGPARVYTSADLEQESNALDQEYAGVQALFAKLEAVRKAMPPKLKGKTGNN